MRPDQEAAAVLALIRLYRRLRPDLVHLVALKAVVLGGLAARIAAVPATVATVAGLGHVFVTGGPMLRRLFRLALRLAVPARARVIVQNSDDYAELSRNRYLSRRLVLIRGSGVDLARFQPAPEPQEPVVVLMAARLLWTKGVGEYVEAAGRLKSQGVSARFLLAGRSDAGNPAVVAPEKIEEWARTGAVEWLGERDDVPELMAASHVVCLPTFYGEGVPKVLIEAAASGRPIVATDMPGCREIVRHDENGLLIPSRDANALAAALARLIADPALRRRLGARGRAIAAADFGVEAVIGETLAVYRALVP
jgi:glycosyltransferase involved in cell wall biosynthesis